jgi:3-phosphoshikimate 1-carboxyvinyltransferase
MRRVVNPLRLMNAEIETSEVGTLPIKIKPSRGLIPIDYKLEVASAQVKSALLLAALHLEEESRIIEPIATRNHTELMLGLSTKKAESGTEIFASRKNYPEPFQLFVPSDISSAAFFIVLALITKNSELLIKNVSLNESRTGIITVLKKMGAEIIIDEHASGGREKMGDLLVRSSRLANVEIPAGLIPNIIDEIPVLAVAGLFAEGEFKVANAKELRVKECDRIKAVCYNMKAAGAEVEEFEDGFVIKGLHSHSEVQFESFGDHRIAMAFAVLSMALESGGRVNQFDAVSISNPGFVGQVKSLTV